MASSSRRANDIVIDCISYRGLEDAASGKHEKVLHDLASSVLRRPIRPYGPLFVTSFIDMLMIHAGWHYTDASSLSRSQANSEID